jgi:spore coat protein A, manganese oxidase
MARIFRSPTPDGTDATRPKIARKTQFALNAKQRVERLIPLTASRGDYFFHYHNLEHEDMAMMANLEVI